MNTQYGTVKLALKSYNEAKINVDTMIKKKQWNQKVVEEKKKTEDNFYSGMFSKIHK